MVWEYILCILVLGSLGVEAKMLEDDPPPFPNIEPCEQKANVSNVHVPTFWLKLQRLRAARLRLHTAGLRGCRTFWGFSYQGYGGPNSEYDPRPCMWGVAHPAMP